MDDILFVTVAGTIVDTEVAQPREHVFRNGGIQQLVKWPNC